MDNAGENKKLQQTAEGKDFKMTMPFTYTARDTPHQNHLVELGFATCANCVQATMAAANLPRKEGVLLDTRLLKLHVCWMA